MGVPGRSGRRPAEGRHLPADARVSRARPRELARLGARRGERAPEQRPCGASARAGVCSSRRSAFSRARTRRRAGRHPAAAVVDRERRRAFEQAGAHYESSYYLTFTWKLPPDRAERAAALFYEDGGGGLRASDERSALDARALRRSRRASARSPTSCGAVLPEVGLLDDDQTLSYLHSTISTHRHPVRAPETPMYLDALLPDMPFTPGDVPMLGDHFLCTCTVSGFPSSTLARAARRAQPPEHRVPLGDALPVPRTRPRPRRSSRSTESSGGAKRKGLWTMIKEEASKQEAALVDNAAAGKAADADAALAGARRRLGLLRVFDDDRHGLGRRRSKERAGRASGSRRSFSRAASP